MVLAVTYPWASASSYLSSQSVADSRCNPHATPRSSYSRRSPSCRFFLWRSYSQLGEGTWSTWSAIINRTCGAGEGAVNSFANDRLTVAPSSLPRWHAPL